MNIFVDWTIWKYHDNKEQEHREPIQQSHELAAAGAQAVGGGCAEHTVPCPAHFCLDTRNGVG